MPDGECAVGAENRAEIRGLKEDQREQWSAIDKLRERLDRLPAWATLMMTGLGLATGASISAAVALAIR